MRVVISQSMYFPWVGLLEQIRLADVFIHYDDVQFSKGSFSNRVQVKMPDGRAWMTVPLSDHRLGQTIDEVRIKPMESWRNQHLALLEKSFKGAPHAEDALEIAASVTGKDLSTVAEVSRESMLALSRYFGLDADTRFMDSRAFGIPGSSSERVLALVKAAGGTDYITGHGAKNYLDHELFESRDVSVSYMDYRSIPYPQSHGDFTPYVTALDLVAHRGRDGLASIASGTRNWKEFIDGSS
jgi:hypothetical protein